MGADETPGSAGWAVACTAEAGDMAGGGRRELSGLANVLAWLILPAGLVAIMRRLRPAR